MDVENKFSELVKKLLNKEQNQQEKERYMRKQFIPTTSDPTVMTKEGLENILDNITVNEKKLQQTFKNRDKATRRSRMTQIEYEKQMKLLNDEKEKALYDIKNYKKLSDKKKTEIQEKLLKSLKKLDVVRRTYLTKSLNEAIKQGIKLNDDYIDTISNITIQRYPLTLEQFKLYMQLNPYTTDEEQHNRNNEFNKYAENIIKTKKFNVVEPEIIKDVINEIKIFDNNNNKMDSDRYKELQLHTSLSGKRDDTILKLPSSTFMIQPYVSMFKRNFTKKLSEKNKSTIKEVLSRLKKFTSSEIDDALQRNNAGTYAKFKELKKDYKDYKKKIEALEEIKKEEEKKLTGTEKFENLTKKALQKAKEERFAIAKEEIKRRKLKQKSSGGRKLRQKKLEVLEEIEEVPEKLSRAGQKPPPGSKNSQELIKQLRSAKNFKELTKKALQKLKEDRFAKAREEILQMRSKKNKPIINQLIENVVEPEIIEDVINEIKIFDNNNNKMEEKKPREKKKVVITRKKIVKSAEDEDIDDILNNMLSDFSNLKQELKPLSVKLGRIEPEISLVKEKSLFDEIEEAEKEIRRVAEVALFKLEKEKTKLLDKQEKRDVKQDKSEFKQEYNKRFGKYMGKKSEFWKTHTEEEARKLGKTWAKAFNI